MKAVWNKSSAERGRDYGPPANAGIRRGGAERAQACADLEEESHREAQFICDSIMGANPARAHQPGLDAE